MPIRLPRAALAVTLLLGACAGTPIVSSYNLVTPPPHRHELGAAIGGRDVPVAVTASPFAGVSPPALATLVVAAMPSLCGAGFVPVAAPAPGGLVWSFAATPAMTADLQLIAPPRGLLSEVQGEVGGVRDAQDPAFVTLVHQMTIALLRPCV
jgi:hypothetical protein